LATSSLTQARLKERLHYDPDTGIFTWVKPSFMRPDFVGKAAGGDVNGYVSICIDRKNYPAHRLAWLYVHGRWPDSEIDHINRNRSDNRIRNLREATHAENLRNMSMGKNNTSGVLGVSWDSKNQKWRAHITVNAKFKSVGRFVHKEDAISARRAAAEKYHGEFASDA
jgi:hypothetical protein